MANLPINLTQLILAIATVLVAILIFFVVDAKEICDAAFEEISSQRIEYNDLKSQGYDPIIVDETNGEPVYISELPFLPEPS